MTASRHRQRRGRRPPPPRSRPQRRRVGLLQGLRGWFEQHRETAHDTLAGLLARPLATGMTVAAIAIALALPAALYLLLTNLEQIGGEWERSAAVSLFLAPEVDEARAAEIAARLRQRADISTVELISRDQGLAEFRAYSGLGGALDQLGGNPLPVVLALYPSAQAQSPAALARLVAALEALPEGDFARLDAQWAQRFRAIVQLLRQAALLLGAMLSLAVLLVIGNTIRLEIENRRTEITIMDLVGATGAFVRRPFLYSGAWYGLLGGVLAWLLVALAGWLLQAPAARLAQLYQSELRIQGLDLQASALLLGGSALLGIVGSWIAVGRHLSQVEPS
ncbi:MAG: cell division protein FtsX [Chromatiaceae bacterium]|nr:MAG: cell division protein FtsX [Chromatiaceae bacterium]